MVTIEKIRRTKVRDQDDFQDDRADEIERDLERLQGLIDRSEEDSWEQQQYIRQANKLAKRLNKRR